MSSILNSSNLIKSIKGRAFIPESQETFTTDRLLEIATEEVNIGIMDQIMDARGDYLVYSVDVEIEPDVREYAIPDRAHGNKLRDAQIVDENGDVLFELSQVTLEEIRDYQGPYSLGAYNVFYLQNNMVVLPANAGASAGYFLRMWFYMRPNKLVQITRAATATAIPTSYEVDNIDALSGNITDISVADPTVITSTAHGLSSGDTIVISGSDSTPSIDGDQTVTVIDDDTFSIDVAVTVVGTTGSWEKTANCVVVSSVILPSHFTDAILYDIVGGISPNKIKLYNISANSVSSGLKTITFRVADVGEEIIIGDYITKAEETIVPNIPTEYHPVLAQRVAVFCLEAMGDEQNKQSAERKLKQMETATLRMIANRVEGAPKKIKNRYGTLNCGVGLYRRGW